jgi:hypothetical protein
VKDPAKEKPVSNRTIAGSFALLAAPIIVIAGTLAQPTLSDDAASQAAALTGHRGAMITAMALNSIAVALLIAGVIWLALALTPRSPRLALAGGVLGVFGLLAVLFDNGVAAAFPPIVGGLDRIQATAVLDRIHSAAAITALGPLSITGDIGLALLGIAAVKAGAPRWAGAAIVAGALGQGAGFATGTKALVITAFAVLFLGLLQTVRTLAASPSPRLAAAAGAKTAAIS